MEKQNRMGTELKYLSIELAHKCKNMKILKIVKQIEKRKRTKIGCDCGYTDSFDYTDYTDYSDGSYPKE